jgi:hypothetical protein
MNRYRSDIGFMVEPSPGRTPGFQRNGRFRIPRGNPPADLATIVGLLGYTDEYDGLESRDVSLRKCAHPVLKMPTLGEIRTPQPVDAKLKFSPYDSQQSDSWQT